uniref:Ig-like domain-containing protein n=1 Tax=Ficedula albicollis TaxID=59894 RepID=A0A803VPJ9_FICAL
PARPSTRGWRPGPGSPRQPGAWCEPSASRACRWRGRAARGRSAQDTEMRESPRLSPERAASTIKHKFKFSFDMGNEPPQIVTEAPAHIHCHEGEKVMLECAVSGQPPPAVSWSLNGQSLSASERLRFEEGKNGTCRLHIREVSVRDAGRYCCVATNMAGTAQTASELTVQPRAPKLYSKG